MLPSCNVIVKPYWSILGLFASSFPLTVIVPVVKVISLWKELNSGASAVKAVNASPELSKLAIY